jgi:hypothetical protein
MDTPVTLPIMGVGDMVDTTIPGVLMGMEVLTGPDTTMGTTMAITAMTTDMPLPTVTVTWITGTLMAMVHPQTLPTRVPKGLRITIPGTGAEQPIPRAPAVPLNEMDQGE